MIALAFLIFLVAILVDVETDHAMIAAGRAVKHIRGALLFMVPLALCWLLTGSGWLMAHLLCLRWLLFDYVLNIRRGLDGIRYVGISADKEPDALTDRLLETIGWQWGLAIKLILCLVTAILANLP